MPIITIAGTPIQFPDSGNAPNWAPAVIQFAQQVASALSSTVGSDDVLPQHLSIDSIPSGTLAITNLKFSNINVQGAFIRYTVLRSTTLTTVSETGTIVINYNPNNPVNNKWEYSRERVGDASVTFTISDTGQVSITTTALSGTNHTGFIYFAAQSMLS